MPLVSVMIPTHNRAGLVTRAIDSALAQSYAEVEVIVIDDGSTDTTRAVLAGYGDRIRVIAQSNSGLAGARNAGLRAARGELLNFLDDDDMLLPEKLARQVAYLAEHPEVDLVLCGWQDISAEDGHVLAEFREIAVDEMLKTNLLAGNEGLLPAHVALVRRRVVEQVGLFDQSLPMREGEDYWLRVALAGFRFAMLTDVLCLYESRETGMGKNWVKLERTMPMILQKVFSHPQLPAEIAAMKGEIYGRSAISFALAAYTRQDLPAAERRARARAYLHQAFDGQPIAGWRTDTFDPIVYLVLAHAPEQPEVFLQQLFDELCSDLAQRQWLYAHLFGKLHAIRAFAAHAAGRRTQVIYHIMRGITYDRGLLKNRGLGGLLRRTLTARHPDARQVAS